MQIQSEGKTWRLHAYQTNGVRESNFAQLYVWGTALMGRSVTYSTRVVPSTTRLNQYVPQKNKNITITQITDTYMPPSTEHKQIRQLLSVQQEPHQIPIDLHFLPEQHSLMNPLTKHEQYKVVFSALEQFGSRG